MINQVVIFAGGKGTRLGLNTAKCLADVCGKPILYYIIKEFTNQKVNKFHFCLGHFSEDVLNWLSKQNIDFTYTIDKDLDCGTWQALKDAEEFLDETFFVTYGDSVVFCDLNFMYFQFLESKQDSFMSVSNFDAISSNFYINSNNEIDCGVSNFVEHGISILKKKSLINFKETIKSFSDFFRFQLFNKVHYACANYYQINTPEDLIKVNELFTKFSTESYYNFLDRDGTINKFDENLYKFMLFEPTNILEFLNNDDCVIITNQPSFSKNITSLERINKMNFLAYQYLIDNGKNILFTNTCLHKKYTLNNDIFDCLRIECNCRKPNTGMLEKSSLRLSISKDSLFYGDSDCDEKCAKNYGLKFFRMYN